MTLSDQAAQSQAPAQASTTLPAMDASNQNPLPESANNSQAPADTGRAWLGEFAEDPAFKDFKDIAGLGKAYRDTKAMVGKPRFDVPTDETPPEVASEFYKKLGVPDAADGYGLKAPEGLPEHMGEYMAETLQEFASKAHELKLTPAQAKGLQEWHDAMAVKLGEANVQSTTQAKAEADTRLSEGFAKIFGDKTIEASERVKATLMAAIPENMRADLAESLPNEALLAIALVEQHYRKTYGQSDSNLGDNTASVGVTADDMRKQAVDLMATKEYRDQMHPDHANTRSKVEALYRQLGSLTAPQKKR
jgi:hypothetical protein